MSFCVLLQCSFVVGNSRGTVFDIDSSALNISCFFQNMLHDAVVIVGIDPQIVALFIAPVQTELSCAAHISSSSNPMNNSVWCIIEPCSFYLVIICFMPWDFTYVR